MFATDPPSTQPIVYHLPQASFDVKRQGEVYRAYSFESYQKLRFIDSDYERILRISPKLEAKIAAQLEIIQYQQDTQGNLTQALDTCMWRLDVKQQEMMDMVHPKKQDWWDNNWKVVVIYMPLALGVGFGLGWMIKDLSQ